MKKMFGKKRKQYTIYTTYTCNDQGTILMFWDNKYQ